MSRTRSPDGRQINPLQYALVGLALVLAAVMYFTRNIDWYGMRGRLEE